MLRTGASVGLLGHYFLGKLRKLRRRGFRALKQDYDSQYRSGNYTSSWFSSNIPFWLMTFEKYGLKEKQEFKALEIGAFEGASSFFIASELAEAHLTCVDTWEGSDENEGHDRLETIEQRFDENLRNFSSRIEKFKGTSFSFFAANQQTCYYDFVYVDGSHRADDVILDAVRGFDALKVGGVMIFDDYLWDFYPEPNDNPCAAINAFLRMKSDAVKVIYLGRQVHIEKIKESYAH